MYWDTYDPSPNKDGSKPILLRLCIPCISRGGIQARTSLSPSGTIDSRFSNQIARFLFKQESINDVINFKSKIEYNMSKLIELCDGRKR